ncbi:hypothetical protein FKW77_000536 [Venturia effusa]|uniref:Uncharacterized protein n=1 Tax=Venturia effusa TaxID=50376 RepID=A0A517L2K4_9PEZI|nr:hypothetical protein FKW77_000536 [Venturia effusa]
MLLITTISAPVVNGIGIFKVSLDNSSTVNFGTFGYCILDASSFDGNSNSDYCTKTAIGYKPVDVMESIGGKDFHTIGRKAAEGLTKSFILHPIASGLTFIAAIIALGGFFGSLVGLMLGVIAWILTVVVMAIDFAVFGGIKSRGKKRGSGSSAKYSVGMWTTLAAMIILLLGIIIVFFTCCTDRRKRSREQDATRDEKVATTSRRRWGRKSDY